MWKVIIGLDIDLVPNRRHAVIKYNEDLTQWRIYASLGEMALLLLLYQWRGIVVYILFTYNRQLSTSWG